MLRYLIDYNFPLLGDNKYNANIAKMDVVKTFLSVGGKFINWPPLFSISKFTMRGIILKMEAIIQAFKSLLRIENNAYVYFQYPCLGKSLRMVVKFLKFRRIKVTFLIHDLEFLRGKSSSIEMQKQVAFLNSIDRLLVHTPQMKNQLLKIGVTTQMDSLILFDYYAEDAYRNISEQVSDRFVIAFAGNLNKSVFLRELDESLIPEKITFRLYGAKPQIIFKNDRIQYEGKFLPSHTSMIHAGWGLVWDGDSIDSCSGYLGNYLKIISPHKLSLYIASGIPVIVWSKSAHAQFVKDMNIGLVVDRVQDVYEKIQNTTDEQYELMVWQARKIGDKLRNGEFLKSLIN